MFALASHIYWGVWALIQARYGVAHQRLMTCEVCCQRTEWSVSPCVALKPSADLTLREPVSGDNARVCVLGGWADCVCMCVLCVRVCAHRYSPIEFDFLEYSALRWSEYHKRRDEFISEARQVFGIQS